MDAGRVRVIVIVAVVALFVSFGAAFPSGIVAHFADAELQLSLRRRIIRHMQRRTGAKKSPRDSREVLLRVMPLLPSRPATGR